MVIFSCKVVPLTLLSESFSFIVVCHWLKCPTHTWQPIQAETRVPIIPSTWYERRLYEANLCQHENPLLGCAMRCYIILWWISKHYEFHGRLMGINLMGGKLLPLKVTMTKLELAYIAPAFWKRLISPFTHKKIDVLPSLERRHDQLYTHSNYNIIWDSIYSMI